MTTLVAQPETDLPASRPAVSLDDMVRTECADPPQRKAPGQPKLMIVDDEPTNVKILRRFLELEGYGQFVTTNDSRQAIALLREERPDLLLLDLMMPHVSGLDILEQIQSDSELGTTPVIILSAMTDRETKLRALELGASDFLNKPVDSSELFPRVRNILAVKAHQDHLRNYNQRLEEAVRERTAQLEASQQDVVRCLAKAAEFRDDDTGHHVVRVGKYARLIGEAMGIHGTEAELLEQAAQLHDVGKIGVPDAVLLKEGRLSTEEFDVIKRHCGFGKRILQARSGEDEHVVRRHAEVGGRILEGSTSTLLDLARRVALSHHEWWDGNGYPLGLKGEDIPLAGRIVAVADVFDALSSRRCYKDAFPIDRCFEVLEEERGTHFDPEVLDAFFQCRNRIIEIQIQYADEQ